MRHQEGLGRQRSVGQQLEARAQGARAGGVEGAEGWEVGTVRWGWGWVGPASIPPRQGQHH